MKAEERPGRVVLSEAAGMLAFRATEALFDEQPDLWKMGEGGRARTLEDFGRHFESLATLDRELFSAYVRYCETLFDNHGFPRRWLTDAWRIMGAVMRDQLPRSLADQATAILASASGVAAQHPS